MTPAELESLASRSLGCLPDIKAPSTLLPRVLSEIERAGQRPWYRQAWRMWPVGWQTASVLATVAMVSLGGISIARIEGQLGPLIGAAGVVWRTVLEPNAPNLAILACSTAFAGTAYCAAIARLLRGGTPRR